MRPSGLPNGKLIALATFGEAVTVLRPIGSLVTAPYDHEYPASFNRLFVIVPVARINRLRPGEFVFVVA